MIEFNIAPNTQIGRIDIPDKIYENENTYNQDKYSRSGEFIENMMTDNTVEFCHRWLGLANIQEFLSDMDEYADKSSIRPYYDRYHIKDNRVLESPLYRYDGYEPDDFTDYKSYPMSPIIKFDNMNDNNISHDVEEITKKEV